jgi:hypothetical protein
MALRSGIIRARRPCKPTPSAACLGQDETATNSHREMTTDDELRILDLGADEIREPLLEEGSEQDEQQAAALKEFIAEIGGLENVRAVFAMLDRLEAAA